MKKALLVLGILIFFASQALAVVYNVTNCSSSAATVNSLPYHISLGHSPIRFAITTAEAGYSTGEAYPGLVTNEATGASWFRIILNSAQTISTDNLWIMGSTQPLTESNNPFGPEVEIRMNGTANTFYFAQSGVTIEGLAINRTGGSSLGTAIALNNSNCCILGCYIGVSATGEAVSPTKNEYGIMIYGTASNNLIGNGTTAGKNIISGNFTSGIYFNGGSCVSNQILGNYIGTNAGGTTAIANGYGVWMASTATSNKIGDGTAGGKNVISGNSSYGIYIYGSDARNNEVLGNYIGTTSSGEAKLGNGGDAGVYLESGPNYNKIGGSVSGKGNIISGNGVFGVEMYASSSNEVAGNYIGLSASGVNLGNISDGIKLESSHYNLIGGTTSASKNVISGNEGVEGIRIYNSNYNNFFGNYIGTNINGTGKISGTNNGNGFRIYGTSNLNMIGNGEGSGLNIISGNDGIGILIESSSNEVLGSYIGVKSDGATGLENGSYGIQITGAGANYNKIGSGQSSVKNVISGNHLSGIYITGNAGTNEVLGNNIGVDKDGSLSLKNSNGIYISSSNNNIIGDGTDGGINTISGNNAQGIYIDNSRNNVINKNYIGLASDGNTNVVVQQTAGVDLGINSTFNKIQGNVISNSAFNGIYISGSGVSSNEIVSNYIGTDNTGTADRKNTNSGILLGNSSSRNYFHLNTIAYNGDSGIKSPDATPTRETFSRNSIFSNGGKGINLNGANNGIASPEVKMALIDRYASTAHLTGEGATAIATVEFFAADSTGQGQIYIGMAVADSTGKFDTTLSTSGPVAQGSKIVATQTDVTNNTSEFGPSFEATFVPYSYQPDAAIATLESGADYAVLGLVETTPVQQIRTRTVATNETAMFYFVVKNVGQTAEAFRASGTAGSGSYTVKYFDSKTGTNEITPDITQPGGILSPMEIAPNASSEIRAEISYNGTTAGTQEITLTIASSNDGTKIDVVKGIAYFTPLNPSSAVDHFVFGLPASAIVGQNFTATLTAYNAAGSIETNVTGTTYFTVDSGIITPESIPASGFINGVGSGNMALSKMGNRTVTATNGLATGSATIIITNATQEYTFPGVPGLKINFPAGATTSDATVTAAIVADPSGGSRPAGFSIGGDILELGPSGTFLIPVTVTMPITGPLIDPHVYYWNGTAWSTAGITIVSYTSTTITFTTTHFTPFAPMTALATNKVRFGPNPYNPNSGSGHFWYWLDADADTSIYLIDLAGTVQFKQTYTAGTNGGKKDENNITYDGKTAWGDQLGQGVYVYKIVQGGKAIGGGKIAVIK